MTRKERLSLIEEKTNQKVVDIEVEKFEMVYWSEDGIIAKYNMKSGKLTITV
jgi:hypothetical protein